MNPPATLSVATSGLLFALGSSALFAIRPVFVKLVYAEGTDPTTLIGLRMAFSLPIYAVILLWLLQDSKLRKRLTFRNVAQASILGWFGYYFASYLDLVGLQYVSAQLGRMVLYVYPTFIVLFGALLLGTKITMRTLASLFITYLGVLIIFGHDLENYGADVTKGSLIILACAACFSVYLLFGKAVIEEMGSRLFTSIALISASIAILCHFFTVSLLSGTLTTPNVNDTALFWIFIIAIFCTVIPTFFTTAAVARIGSDKTGITATVGPGFTSLFAVTILGEAFTLYHIAGIIITIFGVWVLTKSRSET